MEKKRILPADQMIFGGDYNPEQWRETPEIWDEDFRLMRLARWNEVTLGVFAWAELEPEEGVYDFSVTDAIFERAEKNGVKVILATPSGAKPRWLAEKYPEVLRTLEDRRKALYGRRHNHCFSSPVYREKIAELNRRLAERYGKSPALLCWHISNEVSGECHCDYCRKNFIEFVRRKYGNDINRLNHEWWTRFWSHRYDSFEQVEPPSSLGETMVHGQTLDWRRFVTAQTCDFMEWEIKAVREYSDAPVTTNLMGFYAGVDYRELAKTVDFVSWDNYPNWGTPGGDVNTGAWIAMTHDLMRSLKRENFLLMESTPSHVNWKDINKLYRPGMMRLASLQAVAHGSESVQYFQWRKSRGSSDKMHGAAILYDWDNLWALEVLQGMQKQNKQVINAAFAQYRPLWKRGISVDLIGRRDSYEGYDLLIAPMMYLCEEKTAERLARFVADGGTLVGTYAMAEANENDLCHLGGWP